MINKSEVLVKMGELISLDELFNLIEKQILEEAAAGKHKTIFVFPDKVNKDMKDEVYMQLPNYGFSIENTSGYDAYQEIHITW